MKINGNFLKNMFASTMRTIFTQPQSACSISTFAQDLYGIPIYPTELGVEDHKYLFKYNALAGRVIDMYPMECWRGLPAVTEGESAKETAFEKAWMQLSLMPKLKLLQNLRKADILSGIGRFGILYLGLSDGKDPKEEAGKGNNLLYLRAFDETCVTVKDIETNKGNERYGLPTLYSIRFMENTNTTETIVHWTRVIHLAENTNEIPYYGEPRLSGVLEPVLNATLILAGSPHMFMRGGFPGYAFEAEPDVFISDEDKVKMKEQIEEYIQSMSRFMTLQGVKANSLAVQIVNPGPFLMIQINAISASKGIPSRMLMGSEMGHLASTADKMTFEDRVHDRQEAYLTPDCVRPLVERLQYLQILPPTAADVLVNWLKIDSTSQKERAEVSKLKAEALARYASVPLAPAIVPEEYFLRYILQMTPAEISQIAGGESNLPDIGEEDVSSEQNGSVGNGDNL